MLSRLTSCGEFFRHTELLLACQEELRCMVSAMALPAVYLDSEFKTQTNFALHVIFRNSGHEHKEAVAVV
jgi:hypothetical protein